MIPQGTEKDDKAGSVFATGTSEIVEKITKQYVAAHDEWLSSRDDRNFWEISVPLVIRATLEHYRDNVTTEMTRAGAFKGRDISLGNGATTRGFALGDNPRDMFRAMISQALLDLDKGE